MLQLTSIQSCELQHEAFASPNGGALEHSIVGNGVALDRDPEQRSSGELLNARRHLALPLCTTLLVQLLQVQY
jgi:hypothetical protein